MHILSVFWFCRIITTEHHRIPSQIHGRRLRVRVDELRQRPALRRPPGVGGHLGAEVGHPVDVAGDRSAGDALVAVPPAFVKSHPTLEQSIDKLFPEGICVLIPIPGLPLFSIETETEGFIFLPSPCHFPAVLFRLLVEFHQSLILPKYSAEYATEYSTKTKQLSQWSKGVTFRYSCIM